MQGTTVVGYITKVIHFHSLNVTSNNVSGAMRDHKEYVGMQIIKHYLFYPTVHWQY